MDLDLMEEGNGGESGALEDFGGMDKGSMQITPP
jgi:hypothetical protein